MIDLKSSWTRLRQVKIGVWFGKLTLKHSCTRGGALGRCATVARTPNRTLASCASYVYRTLHRVRLENNAKGMPTHWLEGRVPIPMSWFGASAHWNELVEAGCRAHSKRELSNLVFFVRHPLKISSPLEGRRIIEDYLTDLRLTEWVPENKVRPHI